MGADAPRDFPTSMSVCRSPLDLAANHLRTTSEKLKERPGHLSSHTADGLWIVRMEAPELPFLSEPDILDPVIPREERVEAEVC